MAPLPGMINLLCKAYKQATSLHFTPTNMLEIAFSPKIKRNCDLMQ